MSEAGGGYTYPDSAEERAELLRRTMRTTTFRFREVRGHGVLEDDPRRYMLEVVRIEGRGSTAQLHAVTEADVKALVEAGIVMLTGGPLPVER